MTINNIEKSGTSNFFDADVQPLLDEQPFITYPSRSKIANIHKSAVYIVTEDGERLLTEGNDNLIT